MIDDDKHAGETVIHVVNCPRCGQFVDEWCEYPWGPICLACDADATPIFLQAPDDDE